MQQQALSTPATAAAEERPTPGESRGLWCLCRVRGRPTNGMCRIVFERISTFFPFSPWHWVTGPRLVPGSTNFRRVPGEQTFRLVPG
ncbi:hypothetical protein CHLRE_04g213002v5 [Chlamydomonas reinhardtii]|uniref:Uncharacterized protein n=1 Tax=Chlamydomonas reinhardtii TaxID=3055 RepID=A0A2K3DTX4_CHLRE|nr:uncharacterized protein CHLRE_04g213002v5 [Chlamydomonas reinhardtii]PNW83986.1 hypothetical protein CHLRE_04g213002v5 [Chlamydomonas reinhardtii]